MPRITDHFTPLFHELVEPLLRVQLNGTQFRVLFWVARNSYGRMGARFTPYTWGGIARGINAGRVQVSREGRALLKMGILQQGPEGEIGIAKNRIMELGGCENARGGAKKHPCELDTLSVSKTHPLSYKRERESIREPQALVSNDVKDTPRDAAAPPLPPSGFDEFWAAYPRHVAKQSALKAWTKLVPDAGLQARILAAIETQKRSVDWTKEAGKFIPYPASWLNGARWEDEVAPTGGKQHGHANSLYC